jgi:hypothetical protein
VISSENPGVAPADCGCGGNAAAAPAAPSYIYSIGGLRLGFPSLSVEMAFAQQAALLRGVVPDSWLATEVLSQGQNLYLTREMCWVLQIPGPTSTLSPPGVAAGANGMVDAYLMKPRSQIELNEMVSFLQPDQSQGQRFVAVVGVKGPVAPLRSVTAWSCRLWWSTRSTPLPKKHLWNMCCPPSG